MNTTQENKTKVNTVVEKTETKNIYELFIEENTYFKLEQPLLHKITIIITIFTLLSLICPFLLALILTFITFSLGLLIYRCITQIEVEKIESVDTTQNQSIIKNNKPCTFLFTPQTDNKNEPFSIEANNSSTFRKLTKRIDYTHNNVNKVFYIPEGYSVSLEIK